MAKAPISPTSRPLPENDTVLKALQQSVTLLDSDAAARPTAAFQQRKTREVTGPDLEVEATAATDPEAVTLERLDHDDVRLAILQLKSDRQQVILLRFIEGYAVDEVAAALGKSANHVRVLQHRALNELRQLLVPAFDEAQ